MLSPRDHQPPPADLTEVEGSHQWLALAQLAHGPKHVGGRDGLADLLDLDTLAACRVMRELFELGRVRRCKGGAWALERGLREAVG